MINICCCVYCGDNHLLFNLLYFPYGVLSTIINGSFYGSTECSSAFIIYGTFIQSQRNVAIAGLSDPFWRRLCNHRLSICARVDNKLNCTLRHRRRWPLNVGSLNRLQRTHLQLDVFGGCLCRNRAMMSG